MKTLVIGIGNIGRADDGLGWAFADRITGDTRFEVQHRYQLQVEDAELISGYQEVIFVDASHELYENGFKFVDVKPQVQFSYTSHALPPSAILYLCEEIYGRTPNAFLLGISGQDWGLRNGMSRIAKERLAQALDFFVNKYAHKPDFELQI